MSKIKNVMIFGAGSCGRRHYHDIKDTILCFVDNDEAKQGTKIYGKTVISPKEIADYEYDQIIIASIYHTEIKNQLIYMGLENKIVTPTENTTSTGFSPVNFNKFDCSHDAIRADAEYAINNAKGYISRLGGDFDAIRSKSVLELGPGINFGTALILIAFGAKRVTICDRFLVQYYDDYHTKIYKEILRLLEEDNHALDLEPIKECITTKSHNTARLNSYPLSLEKLAHNLTEKFDITLSNAVFEHLYNPMSAFESLYQCMSNNSVGCHQVDFRDHRDFTRPLEFLLLDELSFHALMQDASCEFGNRLRAYQMQAMFENIGFKEVTIDANLFTDKNYFVNFIERLKLTKYSPFSFMDPELLTVVSACITIKKP